MIKALQELANKFNILNHNVRELLFKLYVWNTADSGVVEITLKTDTLPYFEKFQIPTKKSITYDINAAWGSKSLPNKAVKNWGSKSINVDLHSEIELTAGIDASSNYMRQDTLDPMTIRLSNKNASNGSFFKFVISVDVKGQLISKDLVTIVNSSGESIVSFGNYPLSQIQDISTVSLNNSPLVYSMQLIYIENETSGVGEWIVFDFNLLPSYKFTSTGFTKSVNFRDPTVQ